MQVFLITHDNSLSLQMFKLFILSIVDVPIDVSFIILNCHLYIIKKKLHGTHCAAFGTSQIGTSLFLSANAQICKIKTSWILSLPPKKILNLFLKPTQHNSVEIEG